MRQHMRRAIGNGTARGCRLGIGDFEHAGIPAHSRGAKNGHLGCGSELVNGHSVFKRCCNRLVHEHGFACSDDLFHLLQPRTTIETEQQDGVHIFAGFGDATDDAHAILVTHRSGEAFDARLAFLNVRTTAGKSHNNTSTGDVVGIRRIVQPQRELFRVRGIKADDADAKIFCHEVIAP